MVDTKSHSLSTDLSNRLRIGALSFASLVGFSACSDNSTKQASDPAAVVLRESKPNRESELESARLPVLPVELVQQQPTSATDQGGGTSGTQPSAPPPAPDVGPNTPSGAGNSQGKNSEQKSRDDDDGPSTAATQTPYSKRVEDLGNLLHRFDQLFYGLDEIKTEQQYSEITSGLDEAVKELFQAELSVDQELRAEKSGDSVDPKASDTVIAELNFHRLIGALRGIQEGIRELEGNKVTLTQAFEQFQKSVTELKSLRSEVIKEFNDLLQQCAFEHKVSRWQSAHSEFCNSVSKEVAIVEDWSASRDVTAAEVRVKETFLGSAGQEIPTQLLELRSALDELLSDPWVRKSENQSVWKSVHHSQIALDNVAGWMQFACREGQPGALQVLMLAQSLVLVTAEHLRYDLPPAGKVFLVLDPESKHLVYHTGELKDTFVTTAEFPVGANHPTALPRSIESCLDSIENESIREWFRQEFRAISIEASKPRSRCEGALTPLPVPPVDPRLRPNPNHQPRR